MMPCLFPPAVEYDVLFNVELMDEGLNFFFVANGAFPFFLSFFILSFPGLLLTSGFGW